MTTRRRYKTGGIGGRIIAYIIDGVVCDIIACCCPCLGTCCLAPLFACFKDGLRDGRGVGKGMLGLRVVKAETGEGAGYGGSFIRNCTDFCCIPTLLSTCTLGICAACTWVPLLFCLFNEDRQRIGDKVAGTIVIKEK